MSNEIEKLAPPDSSQFGELSIVRDMFRRRDPATLFYVDVGAYGRVISNTYELARAGWRGLAIEANPDCIARMEAELEGLAVTIVNCGVSDESGVLPFYLHTEATHNSFIKGWYPATDTGRSIMVPVAPLAEILVKHDVSAFFDLLSIDTEGYDERIMRSLFADSGYQPAVIVTEATSYKDPAKLFGDAGYELIGRTGGTNKYGNLIYKRVTT